MSNTPFPIPLPTRQVLTISALSRRIAGLLERSVPLVWVCGEVSNLSRAASGHWYFSLKDSEAQIRCVMFRSRNQSLDWLPREGDHVEARVLAGLYAARGEFQLTVEQLLKAGTGTLYEAFSRLKEKLQREGLFDSARKRPLPTFPVSIGIVTSTKAAALRDVLTALLRRAPHVRVVLYPAAVQGLDASSQIAAAIRRASERALRLDECAVLLLVRGGGTIEDLWSFNDESVARAIVACSVPVISGVGHETDFTIADFAADIRAATPTAAAELASPDAAQLRRTLADRSVALLRSIERRLAAASQRLDESERRLKSPARRWSEAVERVSRAAVRLSRAQAQLVEALRRKLADRSTRFQRAAPSLEGFENALRRSIERMKRAAEARSAQADSRLVAVSARLGSLSPMAVLKRGYSLATDAEGRIVRDARQLALGERLYVTLARGSIAAEVLEIARERE